MHKLRDLGNTLLVVEHDREVIAGSDAICDFGPGAGKHGGEIVAHGSPEEVAQRRGSVTGPYLSGRKAIPIPSNRRLAGLLDAAVTETPAKPATSKAKRKVAKSVARKSVAPKSSTANANSAAAPAQPKLTPLPEHLAICGVRHNNLRNVSVNIPLGTLTAITGPSGSGKSSLIDDVLYATLARTLHRASTVPGAHDEIRGIELINKVIQVDQQALGNSPSSNPATYTGVFELIRALFSQLPESKLRGYTARRFSFNVPGGRCEECEGNGQRCIEMHFLPDVWVRCETCNGQRYNPETLAVSYHGRSISDVLNLTCGEAVRLFESIPKIRKTLQTLCDVGLDYLTLGQPAPTLSGGEAQRVKLAAELSRPDTGRTLYLLDEPTTGLHFDDLAKLLEVLHRLVDVGNTVVVIEHNMDVCKQADWIIDMGPEAGAEGGQVVAAGTPEAIVAREAARTARGKAKRATKAKSKKSTVTEDSLAFGVSTDLVSYTAQALQPVLADGPYETRLPYDPEAAEKKRQGDMDITDVGRDAKMPWESDGRGWHTRDRVDRKGNPVKWDGEALARVIDRIHELGEFSDTDWNARSVVEIAATTKSQGWFFHAITGETWLLKMKFRVHRGTFKRQELVNRIKLKTLNEMDELPIYSNEPRIKVRSSRGPWQEVEVRVARLEEIDTPEFWEFLDLAVSSFFRHTERVEQKLDDHTPWKKLGQKWHFMRKGFPPGKRVRWDAEAMEELYELLQEVAPECNFLWNNQVVVRVYLNGQRSPWGGIVTKNPEALTLGLTGPKGGVVMGRIASLGVDPEIDQTRDDCDIVKLRFRTVEDLHRGDLAEFLQEHIALLQTAGAK